MHPPVHEQPLGPAASHGANTSYQSILVVTDLSARENIAVQRAVQLADLHRAALGIVYMPARPTDRATPPPRRLARLARQLEDSLGLPVTTASIAGDRLEELAAAADGMDLLVLPHRRERSTAAFFRGQPVARLLRWCRCPVLVSRGSRDARYQRIMVAVDFSAASESLVRLAADLDPRAELEVFHAICTRDEARLRSAEATEHALQAYRQRCLAHAQGRMVALTDSFIARRNRMLVTIGRGDPGRQAVIQQERAGADLVVVGKKATTAWEDFLSASVAHRVLSWGTSDVLVVPHRHATATAGIAARRLASGGFAPALELAPRARTGP